MYKAEVFVGENNITRKVCAILFIYLSVCCQAVASHDFLSDFKHLKSEELMDTAECYFRKNVNDTALMCYGLIINTSGDADNIERQRQTIEALHKSGVIYFRMCDYRMSYEMMLRALELCDRYGLDEYKSMIDKGIGNIYYRFKRYDIAKQYYLNALRACKDSTDMVILSNNMGAIYFECERSDSALFYFNRALVLDESIGSSYSGGIHNNIALLYQKVGQYDKAFRHLKISFDLKSEDPEIRALNMQNLGRCFFETNKVDSALYYITMSNNIAAENGCINVMPENYMVLSDIEKSRGDITKAFDYFKKYANLQDSVFDINKYGDINQLQRLYEVSKTNRQITQMTMERQIRERTIFWRTVTLYITGSAFLLVCAGLVIVVVQKRRLNRAYRVLVEKNVEFIEAQKSRVEKSRKVTSYDESQNEQLLDKIMAVMEDTQVICDPEFSVDKLAILVQSNHSSVSKVINSGMNKNFRSFLNTYRIREAQRILTQPEASRLTMEAIALRVGFKSRNSFSSVFKEITGVSPSFYLKSIQGQSSSQHKL